MVNTSSSPTLAAKDAGDTDMSTTPDCVTVTAKDT
jgi:hypothetical protein